jgi:peptide/nickel transport system substrate-binding protein
MKRVLQRTAAVFAAAALILGGLVSPANAAPRTLTIGDVSDPAPAKYDPVSYADAQALFFEALYDQLFIRTVPAERKGVKGGLVSSYKLSADEKTLTLTIRSGVRFTDGTTLTGEVVKANLDRRSDKTIPAYSKFDKGGTAEVASVTADGNVVEINFVKAQPGAAYELSGPSGFIVSLAAAKNPELLKSTPYGSGPYKLNAARTIKANNYRLEKQTTHWNKANYPYDIIDYKVFGNAQAHANAAAAGQLDVAVQPDEKNIALLQARKAGLLSKPGQVRFMQWWDKLGRNYDFTADKNVRLAFLYATDREAIVKALFKGNRATGSLVGKSTPGYSQTLDLRYKYNPNKAKQLLAASKFPNPTFTIVISTNDVAIHELLKAQWAKVGIKMDYKVAANGGELFAAVRTGAMGIFSVDMTNLLGWTNTMLNSFPNYQGATNARISAAYADLQGDPTNKTKIENLNRRIVEEAWSLPMYETFSYTVFNKKTVKALKLGSSGTVLPNLFEIKPLK